MLRQGQEQKQDQRKPPIVASFYANREGTLFAALPSIAEETKQQAAGELAGGDRSSEEKQADTPPSSRPAPA